MEDSSSRRRRREIGQRLSLGERLESVAQLIERRVVALHLEEGVEGFSHDAPLPRRRDRPWSTARADRSAPDQRLVRQSARILPGEPRRVRALAGIGLGVAVLAVDQVAKIEVDVAVGRAVDVDVDQVGRSGSVPHAEPGLLSHLPEDRLFGRLPRLDVAARLEPAVQTPVSVQHHPTGTDDDGRHRHVGRVGVPVEGSLQPVEFEEDPCSGRFLPRVSRPVVEEGDPHPADSLVGRSPLRGGDIRCARAAGQADLRRCRWMRRRSRSVVPPQMPSRSRCASACSRQASRTVHTAQIAFASSASSSETG